MITSGGELIAQVRALKDAVARKAISPAVNGAVAGGLVATCPIIATIDGQSATQLGSDLCDLVVHLYQLVKPADWLRLAELFLTQQP